MSKRALLTTGATLILAACGDGSGAGLGSGAMSVTPTATSTPTPPPTPTSTPTPTPTPTTPAPTPTPTPTAASRTVATGTAEATLSINDAIFSTDGSSLFVVRGTDLLKYDAASGTLASTKFFAAKFPPIRSMKISANTGVGGLGGLSLSPDGRYLAVIGTPYFLPTGLINDTAPPSMTFLIDLTTGEIVTLTAPQLTSVPNNLYATFTDTGFVNNTHLIISGYANLAQTTMTSYDLTTTTLGTTSFGGISTIRAASSGRLLGISSSHADSAAGVRTYETTVSLFTQSAAQSASFPGGSANSNGIAALSPTGDHGMVVTDRLYLTNGQFGSAVDLSASLPADKIPAVKGVAFNPDGSRFYVYNEQAGTIIEHLTATQAVVRTFQLSEGGVTYSDPTIYTGDALQVSPDGRYLCIVRYTSVQLIDLTSIS